MSELGTQPAGAPFTGIGGSEDVTHLPKDDARAQATYEALAPGTRYVAPDGVQSIKRYRVTDLPTYQAVPDNAPYIDPTGVKRVKKGFEGVDVGTQTLFDMAKTPADKHAALARKYGADNVKQNPGTGEFSVNYQGKTLKPDHGSGNVRAAASVMAGAAPLAGAVAGSAIGKSPAAAYAGGYAGQAVNTAVLKAAGVYTEGVGHAMADSENTGLWSGAGELAGKVIGSAVPWVARMGLPKVKGDPNALPKFLVDLWGVTPDVKRAAELTRQGVKVRPSTYMKEAPAIVKNVEQFGPAFYEDPFTASAQSHYEKTGGKILGEIGAPLKDGETLLSASARPSSAEAGQAMITRVHREVAETSAALDKQLEDSKAILTSSFEQKNVAHQAAIVSLTKTAADAQVAADKALQLGYDNLTKDISAAQRQSTTASDTGQLWQKINDRIVAASNAMKETAGRLYYRPADALGETVKPDVSSLKTAAQAIKATMPANYEKMIPDVARNLNDLENGKVTLAQLNQLSDWVGSQTNYNPLSGDIKDHVYKDFVKSVNTLIRNPVKGDAAWTAAAKLYRDGDAFYAANRPKFDDIVLQRIVKGTEAGMPANPKELATLIFREENAARIQELKKMVGPDLWPAVEAAHIQSMFDSAKGLDGKVDPKAFVGAAVKSLNQGGLKQVMDSPLSSRVLEQAQRAAMYSGELTVEHLPGDTMGTYLKRVADTKAQLEELAKIDPMGELGKSMKALERQFKSLSKEQQAFYRRDPLALLYKSTAQAEESANTILSRPDLLRAAQGKFGADSAEMKLLQMVGAKRMLQREWGKVGGLRPELGAHVTAETQNILFPGVSFDTMQKLASDMEFLEGDSGNRLAGGLAAQSRVLHPWTAISEYGGKLISSVPLIGQSANVLGRVILSNYYKILTSGTQEAVGSKPILRFIPGVNKIGRIPGFTSQSTLDFLVRGLDAKNPGDREAARAAIRKWSDMGTAYGGVMGAAVGAAATQANEPKPPYLNDVAQ